MLAATTNVNAIKLHPKNAFMENLTFGEWKQLWVIPTVVKGYPGPTCAGPGRSGPQNFTSFQRIEQSQLRTSAGPSAPSTAVSASAGLLGRNSTASKARRNNCEPNSALPAPASCQAYSAYCQQKRSLRSTRE